jgi:hypothetical protein
MIFVEWAARYEPGASSLETLEVTEKLPLILLVE